MANSLYNQLSNNNNGFIQQQPFQQLFNQFGGMQEMLNKFNYFKNNFQGNPAQIGQMLLQSGQLSQQDFNQLSKLATQLRNILH